MKMIELHLLQSFPFTCLNRDAYGSPKTAFFGGVQRARVSSQCWKRAIREYASNLAPEYFAGKRGRWYVKTLSMKLEELGFESSDAEKYAETVLQNLCKKSKEDSSNKGSQENTEKGQDGKQEKEGQISSALFLIPSEIDAIAKMIYDEWKSYQENDKKAKKNFESIIKNKVNVTKYIKKADRLGFGDVAIFGRMIAGTPKLSLEGASLFSHSLSTHRVANEIDFFSAVDDTIPPEESGAGHIGELEANSACYYRYVGLNLDLLFGDADPNDDHLKNLKYDDKYIVLKSFLEAVTKAVPKARRNSMFGYSLPQYAKALVRSGQPLSLVNAFEIPVQAKRDGGYLEPSRQELKKHFDELNSIYGVYKDAKEYELNVGNPFDKWLDEIVAASLEEYK